MRWPLTTLLLRGFELSSEESENGLVAWVCDYADAYENGRIGTISYYRHEMAGDL